MKTDAEITDAPTLQVRYDSNPFRATLWGLAQVITTNPISALLLMFTFILIVIGAVILITTLMALLGKFAAIAVLLWVAIYLFAGPVLIGAYAALYNHSLAGKPVGTFEALRIGWSKALPMLGWVLLQALVVLLGLILFIIPGLIFAAWFSLAPFILMEDNVGPIESMKRSKSLVSGHVIEMIGTMFAGVVLGSSGALAPAVMVSGYGARYTQLKSLKSSGAAKPKVHWINYVMPVVMAVLIGGYIAIITFAVQKGGEARKARQDQIDQLFQTDPTTPSSFSQ